MSDLVDVRIDDREVVATLERLARKVRDLSPVMRQIAGDMLDAVHENFSEEGRPNPWKKSKRAEATGGQTLTDTRRLYNSITRRSTSQGAMVGTNVIYAKIHHFGGTAGRGRKTTIPARPFLVLTDDDRQRIVARIKRYLAETP